MKPALYSVIRYIADPARGEALNVGILLWDSHRCHLSIDDAAVARVIRENPCLAPDALEYLASFLGEAFRTAPPSEEAFASALWQLSAFPLVLTEPRFTTLAGDKPNDAKTTLERLVKRVVRPRRRQGGGPNP